MFIHKRLRQKYIKIRKLKMLVFKMLHTSRTRLKHLYLTNYLLFTLKTRRARRVWEFEREERWFDAMVQRINDDDAQLEWKKDFRVTGRTFQEIVRIVRPRLEKRDTQFRKAIPIEKRVAIAIWRLATGNAFRTISKTFAVGKSTAVQIHREFCRELNRLAPTFIKFPRNGRETSSEIEKVKADFKCKIPQAVGAIDCTHVKILAPALEEKADYFSRKQTYTVNTHAIVGANLVILDIATGFPGSVHDSRVLRHTSVFRRAENQEILPSPEDIIEGQRVGPLILGDGSYPLLKWLIKPYNFGPALSRSERKFNRKLSSVRSAAERCFGLLKARWRCLLKRLDSEIENIPETIITCAVLHNICQINNEEYIDDDGVLENILRFEREARQRRIQHGNVHIFPGGEEVRTALKVYVDRMF